MRLYRIVPIVALVAVVIGGCDRILGRNEQQGLRPGDEHAFTIIDSTNCVIYDSVVWKKENSPYRITEEIQIEPKGVLSIEPGVDVLFDTMVVMIIRGEMRVFGTQADSVRFLPGEAEKWGGIWFVNGTGDMRYARIRGADAQNWSEEWGRSFGSAHYIPRLGGGGISAQGNTNVNLKSVVLSDNVGLRDGGGGLFVGGGSVANLSSCTIRSNVAGMGGGVSVREGNAYFEECLFVHNKALYTGGAIQILGHAAAATLRRCLVERNETVEERDSQLYKSTINVIYGTLNIINSTVSNNFVPTGGSALAGEAEISNSVIWGNVPRSLSDYELQNPDVLSIRFSDVEIDSGIFPGEGNLNADPLFTDPASGDFTPLVGSPLIDAGDPDSPLDPDGSRVDVGAVPSQ